jgi:hypothetical protein
MRMNLTIGAVALAVAVAGCSHDGAAPASSAPPAASPLPTPASSAPPPPTPAVDGATPACATAGRIRTSGYRASINEVIDMFEQGAKSSNPTIQQKATVSGDFTIIANAQIQAGANPAEKGAQVRGMIDDFIALCNQFGYATS